MIQDRSEERGAQVTPRLALRVAIIGTCALVMFAIIFFRLWYLQVLSGHKFVAQANTNSVEKVPVQGPRGEILDRGGSVIAGSRLVPVVQIAPADLPKPVSLADFDVLRQPRADSVLYRKLANAIGISTKPQKCTITKYTGHPKNPTIVHHLMLPDIPCQVAIDVSAGSVAPVTIKTDVSDAVRGYLLEQQRHFPGVIVQQSSLRKYPDGDTAAQLFGTIGPITPEELKDPRFKGVPRTDTVGQSGLEFEYNQYLQGHDGTEKVTVNAAGQVLHTKPGKAPSPGENLQLSIDLGLQRVGERALATSIADNGGDGGAFIAMNPDNGQVYAMGSNPTFSPSVFTHPITQAKFNELFGPNSGDPLFNRAIQGVGPTGSTFKVITATAALQSGDWSPSEIWDDTGQFCFPNDPNPADCKHNSGGATYGPVDLEQALQFSVDTFFYNLGLKTNVDEPAGGPLQQWAKLFGIGRSTGIDLPGAATGTRPSPSWRDHLNELQHQCETASGVYAYSNKAGTEHGSHLRPGWHRSPKPKAGTCEIADGAPWTEGDNVNMAVGQGDVQVSPLQLAVVYAALANGGTIVTPHVGEDIQAGNGTVVQKIDPPPRRHLNIDPAYRDAILQGLRAAASQPGGTSDDVMGNFPQQVYGKTGTAQFFSAENVETDSAWYACFVPSSATSKPIVIVTTVDKGGFGDVAAAPIARQMLSQWFYGKPGKYISGQSTTL
jgi:penicillin-binding protein 2